MTRATVKGDEPSQGLMELSVGPHHPATHGGLRLKLRLDGETICSVEPEQGFVHTGIEKTAESLNWTQAMAVLDRMDYLNPLGNNLCYALAVERLLDIAPPAKASFVRVILCELQRIASHLVFLGTGGLDIGATTPLFWALEAREDILDIFEEVTGTRMHHGYFRAGGLAKDLPRDFSARMGRWLARFPRQLHEVLAVVEENPIFLDRTRGIGVLTPEEALGLGLTGPNLRASGVLFDVRTAYPYSGYERFEFDVPLGKNGDCLDRFLVRFREMEQSFRIISQAFEGLPEGPHMIENGKLVRPPKPQLAESMEALIHHFKLVQSGFSVPAGEVYQSVESPRGELGMYVIADGGNKPARVRVRPPCFYSVHALPTMLEGGLLADVPTVLASVDLIFGEVDR